MFFLTLSAGGAKPFKLYCLRENWTERDEFELASSRNADCCYGGYGRPVVRNNSVVLAYIDFLAWF